MAIRESAIIKILQSRVQNYKEMIEIANANGCATLEFVAKMNGRVEEDESLMKLFDEKEDENDASRIG